MHQKAIRFSPWINNEIYLTFGAGFRLQQLNNRKSQILGGFTSFEKYDKIYLNSKEFKGQENFSF